MINVKTYLFSQGKRIGYEGYGTVKCPYCNLDTDIGTGEHANPDLAICTCGKTFRYWPSGKTQRSKEQLETS